MKLNEKSQKTIKRQTGLSVNQISRMSTEDIDNAIELTIRKKLKFKINSDPRLAGRGSVYIYLGRLLGLRKINKKLSHI